MSRAHYSNYTTRIRYLTGLVLLGIFGLAACQPADTEDDTIADPYVAASDPVEAGRYLVIVAGCNDCHTENYLQTEGDVPEENWLLGSALGWRGPWGTTYPSNLRLLVDDWSEDTWVQTLRTRKALPPMPWMNVNQMTEQDARAMYVYIKSLGAAGSVMPAVVAPETEPSGPYLNLIPENLPESE